MKPNAVICESCGEDMNMISQEPFDREKIRMYCPSCNVLKMINLADYDLTPECPRCGEYIYDLRGNWYARLLHNFIGGCCRENCRKSDRMLNGQTRIEMFA